MFNDFHIIWDSSVLQLIAIIIDRKTTQRSRYYYFTGEQVGGNYPYFDSIFRPHHCKELTTELLRVMYK